MTDFTYKYNDNDMSFSTSSASLLKKIYFPLCGTDATQLKSAITPFGSGDIKIDKFKYLTPPTSTEDLRLPLRNFFAYIEEKGVCSLFDSVDTKDVMVDVGPLYQRIRKDFTELGLSLSTLHFVPTDSGNCEIMQVIVKNISTNAVSFTPTAAVPLFARSLANKHDHEHVTSLLHRTTQIDEGVVVSPVMQFNEEGHTECHDQYYVLGTDQASNLPIGSFPTMEMYCGDSGDLISPEAVLDNHEPQKYDTACINGKEAVGALRFASVTLKPGEEISYNIVIGVTEGDLDPKSVLTQYATNEKIEQALKQTESFWRTKADTVKFGTANSDFDAWMSWVTLQPVLRRIYGCSFLPDHDYGKGGKGWRDIWQDLLSLILIEPHEVRTTLINNFAGVRIDGSNATIIGARPGEFVGDRNAITRVWMDHGVWPFLTVLLYIHQTGDSDILFETNTYFKDLQLSRTLKKDNAWQESDGNQLKTPDGNVYRGSLLEHILIQTLVPFFNVGEHNISRLESADWNDGFDMGFDRGESVAFMSQYGGNLLACADLLESIALSKNIETITLAKELDSLLDVAVGEQINYEDVDIKKSRLFDDYYGNVQPTISGETKEFSVGNIANDLRLKGNWIFEHIRDQEWTQEADNSWYNGYYDNDGKKVEGKIKDTVCMTLTGQVFPIMSTLATEKEIEGIIKSVRTYLKDEKLGGFRLNSDFGLRNYLSLGRAFGFAFGAKENGAFFSHMIVMYAFALYKRGFAREGYEVVKTIYDMCMDTEKSKIYPGIPEYFDSEGRGMYHYLTGSASWLVLLELTQSFGVAGHYGDLTLAPQLVKEEFKSVDGCAQVGFSFASKEIKVCYVNSDLLDVGSYTIKKVKLNDQIVEYSQLSPSKILIKRSIIEKSDGLLNFHVELG